MITFWGTKNCVTITALATHSSLWHPKMFAANSFTVSTIFLLIKIVDALVDSHFQIFLNAISIPKFLIDLLSKLSF